MHKVVTYGRVAVLAVQGYRLHFWVSSLFILLGPSFDVSPLVGIFYSVWSGFICLYFSLRLFIVATFGRPPLAFILRVAFILRD